MYCMENGCKISYGATKPKFCPECGHPIGGAIASKKPVEEEIEEKAEYNVDEDDSFEFGDVGIASCSVSKIENIIGTEKNPQMRKKSNSNKGKDSISIMKQINAQKIQDA